MHHVHWPHSVMVAAVMAAVVAAVALLSAAAGAAATKNVLFFMVDDLRPNIKVKRPKKIRNHQ